ncbi:2-oxoglutarate and iron-dependent oxygenase domain-containing protein [Roseomonas sp. CCTCC AB2023176]|uniref:2-oxoglutarate and iron-dependent oxygenase domain-containing protein n=1 Tax=Roseomonas sp. CCTCC AB2023176 TaxID=3342640 RepID=UPI0035E0F1E1
MIDAIPILDAAGLGQDAAATARMAAALGDACRNTGFFLVVNHGIGADGRDALFAAARSFFALPFATKDAASIRRSPHNRGYVGLAEEQLDPMRPADNKEAFNIGLELAPDDPELAAGVPFRGLNLWPDLPGFRDARLVRCLPRSQPAPAQGFRARPGPARGLLRRQAGPSHRDAPAASLPGRRRSRRARCG